MLDLPALLAPLSEASPSGSDLTYDGTYLELERAGAGKPEVQYGDKTYPAEPPDWRTVRDLALQLVTRARDLRVAVWLARSGARLEGVAGASEGLQLVHGLLATRWADVHPQLDAADDNDPTMRLNALAALSAPDALLADLRSAQLSAGRGSLTVRDVELGLGVAEAAPGETAPSELGVLDGMRAALQQDPKLAEALRAGRDAAEGISRTLDEQLGSGAAAPDLQPLVRLMRTLETARQRAMPDEAPVPSAAGEPAGQPAGAAPGRATAAVGAPGTIATREDVIRTIDRLCEWFDRNEPSNPAPLLLRRAQRLMSKSFIDIVRDLAPEGLSQIEKLAGIDGSG